MHTRDVLAGAGHSLVFVFVEVDLPRFYIHVYHCCSGVVLHLPLTSRETHDFFVLNLQVISLGAGKDSLFFRLRDRGIAPAGGYLEVDFPAVSTWKARVVARNPALSALANGEK